MKKGLEATIAALLAVATPNTTEAKCGNDKVAYFANSYIVALNQALHSKNKWTRNWVNSWGVGQGNLVLDDGNPRTTDAGGKACKKARTCDPYSFIGQTVWDMEKNLGRLINDMHRKGVTKVIIYEGVNSIAPGKTDAKSNARKLKHIKRVLKRVVAQLKLETVKGKRVQVYMAEMPIGSIGARPNLNWHNINEYNSRIITSVGADGIVKIGDAPWKPGKAHGFEKETFPYMLARTHQAVNPGCGYSRNNPMEYQRQFYERLHRKTMGRSGKR